jgi:hypothetical protein
MKIKEFIKKIDVWKIIILISFLVIIIIASGYTINTQWGSIFKNSDDKLNGKITKIKTQTNYSNDMKKDVIADNGALYDKVLREYVKEKNINVTNERIEKDVRYYKVLLIVMNDACEDITINRYIHNNDLYRYKNKNDWEVFKSNVISLYMKTGTDILYNYYDNSKVIMPLNEWLKRSRVGIVDVMTKNTNKLLENLKIESDIYYRHFGGK